MRHLKTFEEFIQIGIVNKVSIDRERAKSLFIEAERKIKSLNVNIERVQVTIENANDYIEYCYDITMFLIRANMLLQGYHANGQGSHEAEVSFTRKIGWNEPDVQLLDQLRYFRNGIIYYGKRLDKEYAAIIIEFTKKKYLLLKK